MRPPSTPSKPSRPSSSAGVLAALALFGAVAIAYGPALRAGFIWDDDQYVTNNPTLRTLEGLGRIWWSPGAVPQYYPLTFTSFWLEYRFFADHATGYHLTNVLLHGLNAVLVWLILRRLRMPGAWLGAALFALHPVHVESVAWITERKNVLSGACYLAALLLALGLADETPTGRRDGTAWWRAALVLALFVAALLAKTVTCTLPVVLLVILWWRNGGVSRRQIVATVPLFVIGIGLALVTIWMERTHVGARGALWDLTPAARVLIAGRALGFQAWTLICPYPLSFVYPRWAIDPGVWWQWLCPLAALAVLAGAWLGRARIGRWPAAALLGFAVTLAPSLGFIDVYPMRYTFVADHYQYLASLFLIAPAAALLTTAAQRLRPAAAGLAPALLAVPLLVLTTLTWRQTLVYADQETLWRDVIAKNPTAIMAPINLGMWLHQHQRSEEAARTLADALRLAPTDAEIHGNLGIVLAALGRGEAARGHLEEAVRLAPTWALGRNNLANALAAEGRLVEAASHYREALRLSPGYAEAQNNLANILAEQGETAEAVTRYRAAIAADPRYVAAHYNLAVVLSRAGRNDEALAQFDAVVTLDPAHAEARRGLAAGLAARGRLADAIPHLIAAARLRPRQVDAQYQLAAALAAAGRTDEAIVAYGRAIEIRPDLADLHNDLGAALAARDDTDAARREFREALRLAPEHAGARANLDALLVRPGAAPVQ